MSSSNGPQDPTTLAQLRRALELCPTPLLVVDTQGQIAFSNPHATELLGYDFGELEGQSVDILVPASMRAGHPELRDAFIETKSKRRMGNARDLNCVRKDGGELPVEISLRFTELSDGQVIVVSIVDVSARTLAERRSQQMVQALPTGMLVIDREGVIQLINTQAERILEYGPGELLGQPVEKVVPAELRRRHAVYREGYQVQPKQRSMGSNRELYALSKTGRKVPVDIGLAPLESATGPQVMASISDISVHRNAEHELRNRGKALGRANKELLAFAYSASHDLKSPLTSISGLLQFCLLDLDQRPDEVRRNLERCELLAKRLATRVESLLTLARIDSMADDAESVDLKLLAAHALQAVTPTELESEIEFSSEITHSGELWAVKARLDVILENLLSNAIKYRKPELPGPTILVRSRDEGEDSIAIEVRDHGQGIEPEFLGRVFDLLSRAASHGEPGSGLGLAIVHKHVLALHGEISVDSSPEGTVFTIRMPKQPPPERETAQA